MPSPITESRYCQFLDKGDADCSWDLHEGSRKIRQVEFERNGAEVTAAPASSMVIVWFSRHEMHSNVRIRPRLPKILFIELNKSCTGIEWSTYPGALRPPSPGSGTLLTRDCKDRYSLSLV